MSLYYPTYGTTTDDGRGIIAETRYPGGRDLDRLRALASGDDAALTDASPELRAAVQAEAERELCEDRA